MDCPTCSSSTRVLETRRGDDGAVRRRRECSNCGERFTTHERRERQPFDVVKRDGERQPFDRTKLRAALLRAAHKRPVSPNDVEALVDRIEREGETGGGDLPASRIGDLALAGLRELDFNSYLQFAAVYRQLDDREAILAELAGAEERNSVRPEDDDAVLPLDTG